MEPNKKPIDFDPEGLSDEEIEIIEQSEEEFEEEGEVGEESDIIGASNDEPSAEKEEQTEEQTGDPAEETSKAEEPRPPSGFVPIAALHQARLREREAANKLETLQAQVDAILAKVNGQKEEQQEEGPDPNDPIGAIEYLMGQEQARKEQMRQQEQMTQQERALQDFRMDVAREFDEAAAEDTQAAEAFEFLGLHARYEYNQLYANSGIPFEKYQQDLITNHAWYARQNGIPIAEYVKKFAATRGYSPGIVAQMKQRAQQGQQDNSPAAKASEEINKVRQKAQVAEQNARLRGGSTGGKGEITLEDLAKMSGAQLEKLVEKNPDILEKLTGVA